MKQKIVVIIGPTATGKTDLGIHLAQLYHGAIISADSRQIYKGLDIGSNKITPEEMKGILHRGIDCADPKTPWTVADFKTYGKQVIQEYTEKELLPFIVGGSALYVDALAFDSQFPEVPPNPALRKQLERFSNEELFAQLKNEDPERALSIDRHNKVRLVRALEITHTLGSIPHMSQEPAYYIFWIGIDLADDVLKQRIEERFIKKEKEIYDEIRGLIASGIDPNWLSSLGIEYRYGTQYVQGELPQDEAKLLILRDSWRLVRKQRVWWKRNKAITWYHPDDRNKIENDLQVWYSNRHS